MDIVYELGDTWGFYVECYFKYLMHAMRSQQMCFMHTVECKRERFQCSEEFISQVNSQLGDLTFEI